MEWLDKYAPEFMCFERKPHIFGNEKKHYLLWFNLYFLRAQIVEGKNTPEQLGQKGIQ